LEDWYYMMGKKKTTTVLVVVVLVKNDDFHDLKNNDRIYLLNAYSESHSGFDRAV